jgi:hypothetical protein
VWRIRRRRRSIARAVDNLVNNARQCRTGCFWDSSSASMKAS